MLVENLVGGVVIEIGTLVAAGPVSLLRLQLHDRCLQHRAVMRHAGVDAQERQHHCPVRIGQRRIQHQASRVFHLLHVGDAQMTVIEQEDDEPAWCCRRDRCGGCGRSRLRCCLGLRLDLGAFLNAESRKRPRFSLVEDLEILLLEAAHRLALRIAHDDRNQHRIYMNLKDKTAWFRRLLRRLRSVLGVQCERRAAYQGRGELSGKGLHRDAEILYLSTLLLLTVRIPRRSIWVSNRESLYGWL